MPMRGRRWLAALLVLLLAAVARGPLHRATYALPVSNDDAIPLLMAGRVLHGELSTTLWNQPYNGALDAYLLAPGLAVASPHAVFRAYEQLCAVLLALLAAALARRLEGEAAGWAAALLAAAGTPYMALMATTGPTPNFLVPLLVGAAALAVPGPWGRALLAGVASGLAVWDSALALPALAGLGAGLLAARGRDALRGALPYAAGVAAGLVPLALARSIGSSGHSTVTALRPSWLWADGVSALGHAAAGLAGIQIPLVVDGPERAALPLAARALLAAALVLVLAWGAARREALPLLGWAGALAAAFALSRRTGPDELRYLYGVLPPVLALCGAGLARAWRRRPAAGAVLALAILVPWVAGDRVLAERWRDPAHAVRVWQVPPLEPVLDTLRRAGVQSAYASLQFAGRLTLESEGRVIASQAWNERIPGDPLRYRDEVDLDPRAAWVLSPGLSRGMPRASGMRDLLAAMGGAWHEDLPGDLVVFRSFRPPYDETRPLAIAGVSGMDGATLPPSVTDRDGETGWTSPQSLVRGSGLVVSLAAPVRVSALVLQVDLDPTPLATPWACDADGAIVARGPLRSGFQWVNGAPRAGRQALLAVNLGNATASTLRLVFQGAGPRLGVREVFVYGPDAPALPEAGSTAAQQALAAARAGDWDATVRAYAEAVRLEPHRAAYHACLARSRWRAAHRRRVDVESLDDGGPALVAVEAP